MFKIDTLYFHFCTLLFICITLAPIYNISNIQKCSVCISLNEDCNTLTFYRLIGKTPVESLSDSDSYCFLEPTANCTFTDEDSICYHHEKFYLSHFENLQQYCSDPWKQHCKQIKSIYKSLTSNCSKIEFKTWSKAL